MYGDLALKVLKLSPGPSLLSPGLLNPLSRAREICLWSFMLGKVDDRLLVVEYVLYCHWDRGVSL